MNLGRTVNSSNAQNTTSITISKIVLVLIFEFVISIYCYSNNYSNVIIVASLVLLLVTGICAIAYYTDRLNTLQSDMKAIIAVILLCTASYAIIFPPFSVPDEAHHYYASYWLSDFITGQVNEDGSFTVRKADAEFVSRNELGVVNKRAYKDVVSNFQLFNHGDQTTTISGYHFDLGSENLPAKIPSTLGILIGRVLNLGPYPMFYLGRLLSCIIYSIFMAYIYRIMPIAKNSIIVFALLPMNLHLAASYSYDPGITILGSLLFCLLLRSIIATHQITRREFLSILITAVLLAPCKIIYTTLVLLVLLIPKSRFSSKWKELLGKGTILICCFASIVLIKTTSVSTLISSNGIDHRGTEIGVFYSIANVISNPLHFLKMYADTLLKNGDWYLSTSLGSSLGWFQGNLALPFFFMIPLMFVLWLSVQSFSEDRYHFDIFTKILFVTISLLSFIGAMSSMLIGWTFNTEQLIMGVQGRYILPVFLPLLFATRTSFISVSKNLFGFCLYIMIIFNCIYLFTIVSQGLST